MLALNCTYSVPDYISGRELYLPETVFVPSVTYQTPEYHCDPKVHFSRGFAAAYLGHSFCCGQLSPSMH